MLLSAGSACQGQKCTLYGLIETVSPDADKHGRGSPILRQQVYSVGSVIEVLLKALDTSQFIIPALSSGSELSSERLAVQDKCKYELSG